MTLKETNILKLEIKRMIELIGFGFLDCSWIEKLSRGAKITLKEYFIDAEILSKRDIVIMLYKNQDVKLWNIIMDTNK